MTTIEIVADSRKWKAHIDDGPAARDFLAQLPLTLTLKDYGGSERIADLPRPLTRKGAPDAVTPRAGNVAFYASWGNLAIFYRDGHQSPGLSLLGRPDGDPMEFAGADPLSVTIRQAERRIEHRLPYYDVARWSRASSMNARKADGVLRLR
ncbi:cyclophilin-like fold protein [Sphingobium sp. SJ10-10]|uniref:cyclophilin-like fold protein n=1 Tax=Sphingobium sp. SJ10-10 TaxID=3114999 RepID=UPI002E17ACC8|nr:cyclophilin-like fold protein [Sphingobium sp. SJ10-10]